MPLSYTRWTFGLYGKTISGHCWGNCIQVFSVGIYSWLLWMEQWSRHLHSNHPGTRQIPTNQKQWLVQKMWCEFQIQKERQGGHGRRWGLSIFLNWAIGMTSALSSTDWQHQSDLVQAPECPPSALAPGMPVAILYICQGKRHHFPLHFPITYHHHHWQWQWYPHMSRTEIEIS